MKLRRLAGITPQGENRYEPAYVYGQPFVTDFLAAFPAALKASTSKMEAMPGRNGLPGAEATTYDVLFAGMLATSEPLI